jgi:hypothetical protein
MPKYRVRAFDLVKLAGKTVCFANFVKDLATLGEPRHEQDRLQNRTGIIRLIHLIHSNYLLEREAALLPIRFLMPQTIQLRPLSLTDAR